MLATQVTGALSRSEVEPALERICSSEQFAASPRLVRFLRYVVEQSLAGRQEQIQEFAIGLEVYDRGKDFDPKADSIVRVEARRLRRALEDYYRSAGAEDPIVITVSKGGYAPRIEMRARPRRRQRIAVAGLAVAASLLGVGALSLRHDNSSSSPLIERTLYQLTADSGLSAWPDITSDGNLIVYSSDRDGGPDLDLWIRHVDRDDAMQLTDEPGDEIEGKFSPDGSLVVYTSFPASRIYTVPTFGGERRLVTDQGKFPRFSPDGRKIAFSQGRSGWSNNLVLLDLDSGRRSVFGESMDWLGAGLLWLPNEALLAGGIRDKLGDWHTVPLDGSEPVGVGARFERAGLSTARPPPFAPQAWLEPEKGVLFAARQGDSIGIWMQPFALETGEGTSPPVKLTHSAALAHDVAASAEGRVVYSSYEQNIDLWRLPMDVNEGLPIGPVERLTSRPSSERSPSSAVGGRVLAFRKSPSPRNAARSQLMVWEQGIGKQHALLQGRAAPYRSIRVHPDGKKLSYSLPVRAEVFSKDAGRKPPDRLPTTPTNQDVFELDLGGNAPRLVCEDCPPFHTESPDGRYRLHTGDGGDARQVVAWEARSDLRYPVLEHPTFDLVGPRYSADGCWIAFRAIVSGSHRRRAYIARIEPDHPTREEEWIRVAPSATYVGSLNWAPSGELLYYVSDEGGTFAIRALRLERETKRPVGEPWLVYQGGGGAPAIQSFLVTGIALYRMAVMEDAIVFDAVTQRGNLWMLDPARGEN